MRRRTIALAGLFAAVACCAGCSSCTPPLLGCSSDAACPDGTHCDRRGGVCVSLDDDDDDDDDHPSGEAAVPIVRALDGTGSALPVNGAVSPDVGVDEDTRVARHRIRDAIVVYGEHLDGVTAVKLYADKQHFDDVRFVIDDGEQMRLQLPSDLRPGLFALTLASAAGSAHADVFLLQGEPGAPAPSPIIEPSAADAAACPSGGVHYAIGVDKNGNGALDDGEENAALARDVCNGDSIFACDPATQTCTTQSALVAPALTVNGLPVKTHLTTTTTINVPADAPTVAAALARFDDVVLDADVDVVLAPGVHDEPSTIIVTRPDEAHVHITGASSATTTLRFTNQNGFQADHDGQLGSIAQLTVVGNDAANTIGIAALNGARVHTGGDVVVAHFGTGAFALRHAELEIGGIKVQNNVNGVIAVDGSYVDATGAVAALNVTGFIANVGSVIEAPGCIASLNRTAAGGVGIEALNESVVIASSCQIGNNILGVFITNESSVGADSAAFALNDTNFNVSVSSSARRDAATGDATAKTVVDSTSTVFP